MKLTITVENTQSVTEVKSVCAMWKTVKELFKVNGNDAHILVTDENGNPYKDLTIQVKANGKPWMVNAVKETNRKPKAKVQTEETHTIDEATEEKPVEKKNKKRGAIIAA